MNVLAVDYDEGFSYGAVTPEIHAMTDRKDKEGFRNLTDAQYYDRIKAGTVGYVESIGDEDGSVPRNSWAMVDFGYQEGVKYTKYHIPTYMLTPTTKPLPNGTTEQGAEAIRQKYHLKK